MSGTRCYSCVGTSTFPSTFRRRDWPFPTDGSWRPRQKAAKHVCAGSFLASAVGPHVDPSLRCYCSFVLRFKLGNVSPPISSFFQVVLGSLQFHLNFRIRLSMSTNQPDSDRGSIASADPFRRRCHLNAVFLFTNAGVLPFI